MVILPDNLKDTLPKDIEKVVSAHLGNALGYELFFFGSRVTGTCGERSDIDVGIRGPKQLLLDTVSAIQEGLEKLPTLFKIDFVDFSGKSNQFSEVALKNISLIKKYE